MEKGLLLLLEEDIAILPQALQQLQVKTKEYFTKEETITLGQFRDLFQTSRKYALAFLEYLDRQDLTSRDGDVRRLSAG
jgi:selenocysteine-specific elongation factor